MSLIATLVLAVTLPAASAQAQCGAAAGYLQTVCDSPALAAKMRQIERMWDELEGGTLRLDDVPNEQTTWQRSLRECADGAQQAACLEAKFDARIQELTVRVAEKKGAGPTRPAPADDLSKYFMICDAQGCRRERME
jgi:uncharacterized protein